MMDQFKLKKGNTSPSLVNAAECQPPAAMSTCKQMKEYETRNRNMTFRTQRPNHENVCEENY